MIIKTIKYLVLALTLLIVSCNRIEQRNSAIDSSQTSDLQNKVDRVKEPFKYGAGDIVTDAVLDTKGNMWFTTTTEGVFKYDGMQFTNFTKQDGLCNNKLWSVLEDNEGMIWLGTNDGLCKYNGTSFLHVPLPKENRIHPNDNLDKPISSANSVASLLQDASGNIWVGTGGGGAYRYDGKKFSSFLSTNGWKQPDSLYFNIIQSMVEDDAGSIWFTSLTHGGISRFDGQVFSHFTKDDGMPDDMIFSSFKDGEGTLWFGTLDGGLISYKDGAFQYYDEDDGLCNNNVSSFYQDKTGRLWIGSFRESTICWYDGASFTSVPFDEDQNLVELKFMAEDAAGHIWIGGRYGILWRYDGIVLKDFTQEKRGA